MNTILLFIIILIFSFITVNGTCVRNKRKPKRLPFKKHLEYIKTYPRGLNDPEYKFGPMRIKTYYVAFKYNSTYYDFSPSMTTTEEQYAKVKETLDWVLNEIKKIITGVRRVKSRLLAPRYCMYKENNKESFMNYKTNCSTYAGEYCSKTGYCGDLPVPANQSDRCDEIDDNDNIKTTYEKGEGVTNVDLLLYYSMANCSGWTLAFADVCVTDINLGTPTVGMITICYDKFFSNDPSTRRNVGSWRSTILHELLHIFLHDLSGISYLDQNGNKRHNTFSIVPRKWRLKNGTYIDYEAVLSTLPNVVEFAKKHFNCSSLKGLDLQTDRPNYTKDGMEKSPFTPHVEHIFFPDALMAPYSESGVYITKLEAAFLKDTGWYTLNEAYDFAELTVTRNKGCIFVDISCHDYMEYVKHDPVAMYPYCRSKFETACSPDHRTAIVCKMPPLDENEEDDAKKYKKEHKDNEYDEEEDGNEKNYEEEEGDENNHDEKDELDKEDDGDELEAEGFDDQEFDDWRVLDCPFISSVSEDSLCFYKNTFYGFQEKLCVQMNDVFRNGVLNDSKGFCQPFSCKTDVIEINVDSDNVIECGHKQVKNTLLLKQTSASEYSPFDEVVCPDISSVCQISHGITPAPPKVISTAGSLEEHNYYFTNFLIFLYFWLH